MSHPYRTLADKAFWRRSVAAPARADVDPVGEFRLRIHPETKVATAGSCFAQHIARHLQASGFRYHVAEPGHPLLPESVLRTHQYGTFSARYGNIYTSRQLLQLMQRAYGEFEPDEVPWRTPEGRWLDPFRPTVEPGGFAGLGELLADREQHFAAVRRMFETLDVFVFTLGLTECWVSRSDGAAFPLCPGVEGGEFHADRHRFVNLGVSDVLADLREVRERLLRLNPSAQIVLTVSPVPLMATAQPGQHVLSATTYSKSVLRVAAEEMRLAHEDVHYFPSFEIITGSYTRGAYFADDLRNVTEEGVSHVMKLFLRHAAGTVTVSAAPVATKPAAGPAAAQLITEVECDEIALDRPTT
jgi:hypothetical protein